MGKLVRFSGRNDVVDIDTLEPGIYGDRERWISDQQLDQLTDHVCAIPQIWELVRNITDDDRIEGELELRLWTEVRDYVIKSGWVASGGDTSELVRLLRERAAAYQGTTSNWGKQ